MFKKTKVMIVMLLLLIPAISSVSADDDSDSDISSDNFGMRGDRVAVGTAHGCAIVNYGSLYCWGSNNYGQLGDGTNMDRSNPVMVSFPGGGYVTSVTAGYAHTCALIDDGSVYCWGSNSNGQLGNGECQTEIDWIEEEYGCSGSDLNIPTAVSLEGMTQWWDGEESHYSTKFVKISSGPDHVCGIREDGPVYCWGYAAGGGMGRGEYTLMQKIPNAVSLPHPYTAVGISLGGESRSCAIMTGGSAVCWGKHPTDSQQVWPEEIQTGRGHYGGAVAISVGRYNECMLLDNNSAYCSGPPGSIDHLGRDWWGLPSERSAVGISANTMCAMMEEGPPSCVGYLPTQSSGPTSGEWTEEDIIGNPLPGENVLEFSPTPSGYGSYSCAIIQYGNIHCFTRDWYGTIGDRRLMGGNSFLHGADTDGDGWANQIEDECGVLKFEEDSFPVDTDSDGICDGIDSDDDGDGWSDTEEIVCGGDPLDSQSRPVDTDLDLICDPLDEDDDGDGWSDTEEINCGKDPLDETSTPGHDTDSDGICDEVDFDDDGDGWSDTEEIVCGGDPLDSQSRPVDTDSDGICDGVDTDDDADGVLDEDDESPLDIDSDNDGIRNDHDICEGHDDSVDTDADGEIDGCQFWLLTESMQEFAMQRLGASLAILFVLVSILSRRLN